MDVGNLISGSSAFSKTSLNIWKFTVHVLLKPCLENFKHYFTSMWDECNCVIGPYFLPNRGRKNKQLVSWGLAKKCSFGLSRQEERRQSNPVIPLISNQDPDYTSSLTAGHSHQGPQAHKLGVKSGKEEARPHPGARTEKSQMFTPLFHDFALFSSNKARPIGSGIWKYLESCSAWFIRWVSLWTPLPLYNGVISSRD